MYTMEELTKYSGKEGSVSLRIDVIGDIKRGKRVYEGIKAHTVCSTYVCKVRLVIVFCDVVL
jgi:hypothetical protein